MYENVFTFSKNPNLYDLIEWKPLTLQMRQGRAALVASMILLLLGYRARKSLSLFNWILLLVLGIAMLKTSRMIVWWAPIAALEAVRLLQANLDDLEVNPEHVESYFQKKTFLIGACLILISGIVISIYSVSFSRTQGLLESPEVIQVEREGLSTRTPVQLTRFLLGQENRQPRRILHPMEWGDFFIWTFDRSQPVFTYSHVHLIPETVWNDYLTIMREENQWKARIDHYNFDVIILDKHRRKSLIQELQKLPDWKQIYEDRLSIVFEKMDTH
ncbi:MAG: hypothetical protein R3C11_13180 [Planctomycetaceae bacterium]